MRIRRRVSAAVVAGVIGSTLSGCWLQPGFGPQRRNFNPFETTLTVDTLGRVGQVWSVPIPGGNEPLVAGNTVYTGAVVTDGGPSGSGSLVVAATERTTGARRWERSLFGSTPFAQGELLSVAGDQVLAVRGPRFDISGIQSDLVALDPATGTTLASVRVDGMVRRGNAVVAGNQLAYVTDTSLSPSTGPDRLVVADRATLATVWSAPLGGASSTRGLTVLVAHDLIHLTDPATGELQAYPARGCGSATCPPVWTIPPPPPDQGPTDTLDAAPLAATDDHLLIRRSWSNGTDTGQDLVAVTATGPTAGTVAWTLPLRTLRHVATDGDTVYVTGTGTGTGLDGTERLIARTHDGQTWRADLGPGGPADEVVVAGGLVHVAAAGDIHVFAADGCGTPDCPELATLETGPATGDITGMSLTAGTLHVATSTPDPHLIAFSPTADATREP